MDTRIKRFFTFALVLVTLVGAQPVYAVTTTNLNGYWTLDEASGTRADSTANNNDLTDVNTVGAAAGIINNGADFEATASEYLSLADTSATGLDGFGTGFSIQCWMKVESTPSSGGFYMPFGKWGGGGGDAGNSWYLQYFNNGGTPQLIVAWNEETTFGTSSYSLNHTLSTSAFEHVVVVVDTDTPGVTFYIDNSATAGSAGSTGGDNGTVNASVANFFLGAYNEAAPAGFFDGILDECAIWDRALTADDVADLYNGGAGLAYPFAAAGGGTLYQDIIWFD